MNEKEVKRRERERERELSTLIKIRGIGRKR